VPIDEPLVETEVADSEPQRRSGPWKLIIIVAVVTLIGVWLVPDETPREDAPMAQPPAEPADATSAPPPSLLGERPGDEPAAETAAALPDSGDAVTAIEDNRPGAQARALISRMRSERNVDLNQVIAVARTSQIGGELADAYLLYFFAAREGSSAAALELGKQADPATRDPLSSVFEGPDFNQAHKWYQIAARGGSAEARDRLKDLHQRVEQLAASGDPQAQRILLLWQ
jgi:TPR repeat protein